MRVEIVIEGRLAGVHPVNEVIEIDDAELEGMDEFDGEAYVNEIVNSFVLEGGYMEWGWNEIE